VPKTTNHHILSAVLLTLLSAPDAPALECHVDTTEERFVRFISDAPVEDFDGVTDQIDGYVLWNGEDLTPGADYSGSEFYFEVALATLNTGIGLRNSHMRENYLETDQYPYATYRGTISQVDGDSNSTVRILSVGTMTIHGVERPYEIVCDVEPASAGYRVRAQFQVALPDFDIEVPSLMFLKINEIMELELDFHLKVVPSEQ
jgi:polyisoprenoid-binding protein YceI